MKISKKSIYLRGATIWSKKVLITALLIIAIIMAGCDMLHLNKTEPSESLIIVPIITHMSESYQTPEKNIEELENAFHPVRLDFLKISLGMDIEGIVDLLGQPNEIEEGIIHTLSEGKIFYYYDFGSVAFTPVTNDTLTYNAFKITINDTTKSDLGISIKTETEELLCNFDIDVSVIGHGMVEIIYDNNIVGYILYNDSNLIEKLEIIVDENDNRIEMYFYESGLEYFKLYASDIKLKETISTLNRNIFLPTRTSIFGLPLDSSEAEAKIILGNPTSEEEKIEQDIDKLKISQYEFGNIEFLSSSFYESDEYILVGIEINQSGFSGPRDIEVGDTVQDLAKKIGIDIIDYSENNNILYREFKRLAKIEYNNTNKIERISYWFDNYREFAIIIENDIVSRILIYSSRD